MILSLPGGCGHMRLLAWTFSLYPLYNVTWVGVAAREDKLQVWLPLRQYTKHRMDVEMILSRMLHDDQ
jgi:hypothetical protein